MWDEREKKQFIRASTEHGDMAQGHITPESELRQRVYLIRTETVEIQKKYRWDACQVRKG